MHHSIPAIVYIETRPEVPVADVRLYEVKRRLGQMCGEVRVLSGGIVIVVKVINDRNVVTKLEQRIEQSAADEARAAREQDSPARHLQAR